ncbi:response regulator [Paraburkholderia sp.]|uniref:response regulator n=1 Tax=Paraburkholderia sp. TaxID=1926495 RepID=UPI003D6F6DA9
MILRVILADDHPFVLLGTRVSLAAHADVAVVGEAGSPAALLDLLRRTPCDVLVTDLTMPEADGSTADGLRLLTRVRHGWPALRIVVLTGLTNAAILRAILAEGVTGILNKIEPMDELIVAIRRAACGHAYLGKSILDAIAATSGDAPGTAARRPLSPREAEVVRLFADGQSISGIARTLGRDIRTVSRQKRDAMVKLGVRNDAGLFIYVRANGLL